MTSGRGAAGRPIGLLSEDGGGTPQKSTTLGTRTPGRNRIR